MSKASVKSPPPPWLGHIGSRERKQFDHELRRLGQHVASWSKQPDQPFNKTSLGQQTSYESDKAYAFALAAAHSLVACREHKQSAAGLLAKTLAALLRRSLPCTADDLVLLTGIVARSASLDARLLLLPGVLAAAERLAVSQPLPEAIRGQLAEIRRSLAGSKEVEKKAAKLAGQIDKLCDSSTASRLSPDEGWADELRSWVEGLPSGSRKSWETFLAAAAAIAPEPPATSWNVTFSDVGIDVLTTASEEDFARLYRAHLDRTPAAVWRQEMNRQVESLSAVPVADRLRRSLHLVRQSKPGMLVRHSLNRELMRGFIWLCVDLPGSELPLALQQAATYFYANNSPLATAAVAALCRMPGRSGAAPLATIAARLKSESQRKFVSAALSAVAERLGVDPEELADEGLPDFGFTEPGRQVHEFGDAQAELRIVGSRDVEILWSRSDKPLKSAPAAVKRDYAEGLANLTATAAGVREALAGLATRLELMWLAERRLPLAQWREQVIDHPVAGKLGSSLVWQFNTTRGQTAALWHDDGLVTSNGAGFDPPADAAVELWHPLSAEPSEVLAWRERLESLEVTQPFKQAHRELYLLTDAERQTRTYSNRFAAHILRQAQFRVLAKSRGWKADLVGPWDGGDHQAAQQTLPRWNLRAEFWIQGAGDECQTGYTYISTDQLRFYRIGETELLSLEDLPPLVFSEVMRDVDLFVGVASVGNDPHWVDGGPEVPHYDYWQHYSFGELSATAHTRKEVLQRIIPRLAIAGRCSFEDRFLVVKGKLRTYKIHLGSGNILMRPNDEYLCIVPDRSELATTEKVFLPFEGDRTLSIILSKALLLADDDQIKDETITRQTRRH